MQFVKWLHTRRCTYACTYIRKYEEIGYTVLLGRLSRPDIAISNRLALATTI